MKGKNFIIKIQLYKQDILVSVGESDEQISKKLTKLLPSNLHAEIKRVLDMEVKNTGRCAIFSNGAICIRLLKTPNTCEQYGVLAHEIFHAVELMADRVGLVHSWQHSSEAFAYAIEYLTTEIYKKL